MTDVTITPHAANTIMVLAPLTGGNYSLLNSFPGHFRWQGRNVVVRTTDANLRYLINSFPDAKWIGGSEEVYAEHQRRLIGAAKLVERKSRAIAEDLSDVTFARPPMPHQERALGLSRNEEAFALLMEQGTGKTKVIIDNACDLFRRGEITTLVVVAWPNGVHRNWVDYELPKDMSVAYEAVAWSSNHSTKRNRERRRALLEDLPEGRLRVACFNVESFVSPAAREFMMKLLAHATMLVVDQSASIKNPHSKRAKFLIDKAAPRAKFRRILDGQPVAEGGWELFAQFKFLDESIIGHDTWTAFKNEFCRIGRFNEVVGYTDLPELHRRIDPYCFRVRADECQNLPPRIYNTFPFELEGEERRVYDDIAARGLAFFLPEGKTEAEAVETELALAKHLRLSQIASGWWPQDGTTSPIAGKPSRLRALLELLKGLDGKSLIFSRFRADLDAIMAELGSEAVGYFGGMHDDEKAENKARFLTDDAVRYFVGQPTTAGIGHTLTAARNVIFYTNHPSLRYREECEKRAHREGQTADRVLVFDLVAENTIDDKTIRALRGKKDLANELLRDPDAGFLR